MPDGIDADGFAARLVAAAGHVRGSAERLSQLDSAVGDGDHGSAMIRVCDAIAAAFAQPSAVPLAARLSDLGWAVMSAAGGSTSTLYGSFFAGLATGVESGFPLDCGRLAAAFEAATAELRSNTKAQPGGKTLIDALLPAVQALRTAADAGASIPEALRQAAAAAERGADATKEMKAAFGRARNLGDRTVGHLDPGAVSMALFFRGFAG